MDVPQSFAQDALLARRQFQDEDRSTCINEAEGDRVTTSIAEQSRVDGGAARHPPSKKRSGPPAPLKSGGEGGESVDCSGDDGDYPSNSCA